MADRAELIVDGRVYSQWTSASLTRSLETCSSAFTFAIAGDGEFPVTPGAAVQVRYAGEIVLTGFVDKAKAAKSRREHSRSIEGRSRTGQLVDCSATNDPGQWFGLQVSDIAADIAGEFGIQVRVETDDQGSTFEQYALQPGEGAWEAIERACRLRSLLATADAAGDLLLTRAGAGGRSRGLLVEGGNILDWSLEVDLANRYRRYVVRGQQPNGTDTLSPEECAGPEGEAEDLGARAGRTLIVIAEGAIDLGKATRRAAWEAAVRLARSSRFSCKVQGWRETEAGPVWRINTLVRVRVPSARLDLDLLLIAAKLELDKGSGTTASLEFSWPDAYLPEVSLKPEPEPGGFGEDVDANLDE